MCTGVASSAATYIVMALLPDCQPPLQNAPNLSTCDNGCSPASSLPLFLPPSLPLCLSPFLLLSPSSPSVSSIPSLLPFPFLSVFRIGLGTSHVLGTPSTIKRHPSLCLGYLDRTVGHSAPLCLLKARLGLSHFVGSFPGSS